MARLFFDLTGLLHWYAYFDRPAGVQRVIEQLGRCPLLQEASQQHPSRTGTAEFVVRLLGTDRLCRLDPALLRVLGESRAAGVVQLRRRFAEMMRQTTLGGLIAEGRYFHVPYVALGLTRTEQLVFRQAGGDIAEAPLQLVAPPNAEDTLFNPGDLWWQKHYVSALSALKRRSGLKIVQMIHDLYVLERPDWSPPGFSEVFTRQLRGIAPLVDHWITSSIHVKHQLRRHLQDWSQSVRPISVLPMGWDSFSLPRPAASIGDRAILQRHGIGHQPYILFVGTIEPRKNVAALLDAMDRLRGELGDRVPALVLAGGYGWQAPEVRARLEKDMRDGHLFWIRSSTDEELRAFYQGACFTVMPSHGEGWGLAVQESIALGVPCLASSGGATREAGLDLAIYFDPSRPEQLKDAIATWILNRNLLAEARSRIEQALNTRRLPTWNDAGQLLLQAAFGSINDSHPKEV